MDKYDTLMNNLKEEIPFALARFNDGEMMGIGQPGCIVARGDQVVPQDLSDALKESLEYEQDNYWKGLPCGQCFPEHRKLAEVYVNSEYFDKAYEYLTHAVVFTNRNWMRFIREFPQHIKGRMVYWVGGDDQNLSQLPFEVYEQHKVPAQDGWSVYSETKDLYGTFDFGSIVLAACGPMARVLTRKWFEKRPDLTIIDIGSTFDPFTRNVWHNCHKGWRETGFNLTARCEECN